MGMNSNSKKIDSDSKPGHQAIKGREGVMNTIVKTLALVATLFCFANSAMAQEAPAPNSDPTKVAPYFWGEDAKVLMTNIWMYDKGVIWADSPDQARKGLGIITDKAAGANVNKPSKAAKARAKAAKTESEAFLKTLSDDFKPLAPSEFTGKKTAFAAHMSSFGCEEGVPESQACKDIYQKSKDLADKIIAIVPDTEERKQIANGFLTIISDDYRNFGLDKDNKPIPDDFYHLTLAAQAAVMALPLKYNLVFSANLNGLPGTPVAISDLASKANGDVTIVCPGEDILSGRLEGISTDSALIIRPGPGRGQITRKVTDLCVILYKTGGFTQCEYARTVKTNGQTEFYGYKFVPKCGQTELLLNKEVIYCDTGSEPISTKIVENTTSTIIVENGEARKTIECADVDSGKTLLALKKIEDGTTTVLTLSQLELQFNTIGLFGIYSDGLKNAAAVGVMAHLMWTPVASEGFAAHVRLGLGGLKIWGLHEDATDDVTGTDRADFIVSLGIGGSAIVNDVFSMSLFGDVYFTLAGFGGGGGEFLFKFKIPNTPVSLFFGPTIAYLISGVKPGTNEWDSSPACADSTACANMPKETRFLGLGFSAGIGFDLIKNEPYMVKKKATPEPETAEVQAEAPAPAPAPAQ
jgi:hypothetical protein